MKFINRYFFFKNGDSIIGTGNQLVVKPTDFENTLQVTVEAYLDDELVASAEITFTDVSDGKQGPKGDDGVSPINLIIESSNGYQFKNNIINTTFTAKLYQDNKEIDKDGTRYAYVWSKVNADGTVDTAWNLAHQASQKSITITNSDVWQRATFNCTAEPLN